MSDQNLYQRIGVLINTMPPFEERHQTADEQMWLAQVRAAINNTKDTANRVDFSTAMSGLQNYSDPVNRAAFRSRLRQCLYNALIATNVDAPSSIQGAFLPAGNPHDALVAVASVLATATKSVMLVDPYGDAKILEAFGLQAAEGMLIEILSDEFYVKPNLKPSVAAWKAQYASKRPLEVRLSAQRALHDRLIIVDGTTAWIVGQSFKDLAARAPTSITRLDVDTGTLKIAAHMDIWKSAISI